MTQEEKARAYDKALEKARKRVTIEPQDHTDAILKDIFPELDESEDEKIRKRIYGLIYHNDALLDKDELLAYLEKQKKQKPVEDTALQKAFVSSKIDYTLEEKCDASDYADAILPTSVTYGENEEEYKLHKIIEAAFIAGQKKGQKLAEWSGEDEERLSDAIFFIREYQISTSDKRLLNAAKETEDWLKSLLERFNLQFKQEWSEEDEKKLGKCIDAVSGYYSPEDKQELKKWLKSLRGRFVKED